jgi:hypothetical protein
VVAVGVVAQQPRLVGQVEVLLFLEQLALEMPEDLVQLKGIEVETIISGGKEHQVVVLVVKGLIQPQLPH